MLQNMMFFLNCVTFKLETDDFYKEKIQWIFEKVPILLCIRDGLAIWAYHIQCASLIMKCIFRYTYAKYPFASEIWKKKFGKIVFITVIYSFIITIPFIFIDTIQSDVDYYAILMNVETSVYFIITTWIGYLTHLALKNRSSQFMNSIRKLNYYLMCDLVIHAILFFGILIPMVIFSSWSDETKNYILIFVVDVVGHKWRTAAINIVFLHR
ncbi:CRE-SRG-46 protein [Caenorhabditis remanei]|uniref:CRE-SRG-46 protein n=1 Tax=Caenorhabditis remanei TaxID=31234 RepID=E3LP87_CAERE|nr:CRE-SRG-46 protein [Caenorhabditis remanei]